MTNDRKTMPDQPNNPGPKKDRSLSEISHLFLSSVRARHPTGAPRPLRKPPQPQPQQQNPMPNPNVSIDMTPEEFARQYGTGSQPAMAGAPSIDSNNIDPPQVSAIIGAHLNGKLFDRVKDYASHLCGTFSRVGLIEVDVAELRLMLFERHSVAESISSNGEGFFQVRPEEFDVRRIAEALEELSWDVEQWLLLL